MSKESSQPVSASAGSFAPLRQTLFTVLRRTRHRAQRTLALKSERRDEQGIIATGFRVCRQFRSSAADAFHRPVDRDHHRQHRQLHPRCRQCLDHDRPVAVAGRRRAGAGRRDAADLLLAIPAGVLSDILDRRKFLIAIQLLLAIVSVCLMLLSFLGLQSIGSLVALTFLGGIGAALMGRPGRPSSPNWWRSRI